MCIHVYTCIYMHVHVYTLYIHVYTCTGGTAMGGDGRPRAATGGTATGGDGRPRAATATGGDGRPRPRAPVQPRRVTLHGALPCP